MRVGFLITYASVGLLMASFEVTRQGDPQAGSGMFWISLALLAVRVYFFN